MAEISSRRQAVMHDAGLITTEESKEVAIAIKKENARREKIKQWQDGIINSPSYKATDFIAVAADKWFLDPIIGLIPGIGDVSTGLFGLPAIYVSAIVVGSYSLTMAIITNILLDILLGVIPILGIFLDFAYRSNLKNQKLIRSYVKDEPGVRRRVKRKAFINTVLFLGLLYIIFWIITSVIGWAWNLISDLFS